MSCWVVPAVAAELWGVPVNAINEKIRSGALPSKLDLGFTLVDVAPGSPKLHKPAAVREPAPRTFVPVEEAELDGELEAFTWKGKREAVGRTRRPPVRELAAAA